MALVRILRLVKRFFQFGYNAYRSLISKYRFEAAMKKNRAIWGECRTIHEAVDMPKDLTVAISSGAGLFLLRNGMVYKLFNSMGYIFGLTTIGERLYFLHLFHADGNSRHSAESYRCSEIYSTPIEDLVNVQPGQKLEVRRELSQEGVLYSYCNTQKGKLYAIDYLGKLSVFEIGRDGIVNVSSASHFMVNRHFDGSPLLQYAFTHFNSLSVVAGTIYLGGHGRKAQTGRFSGIYSVSDDLDPETLDYQATPFVHSHDTIVANRDLYVCDSKNVVLTRNGRKILVRGQGFMRGLSIMENRLLLSLSSYHERRQDRNSEKKNENSLILLEPNGKVLSEVKIKCAQIYNTLVISEPDYSVSAASQMQNGDASVDIERLLHLGEARSVSDYYGNTSPPFSESELEQPTR